jgi:Rieske Fe-S protein
MSHQIPRRAAVGFAVVGAACAACTRYGAPAGQPAPEAAAKTAGAVLGKADDVPVGGGVVFRDAKIVVTRPADGEFKGFSAVCTHQGCLVAEVRDGSIVCDCHGSTFTLDGAVETGPATKPLPARQVSVNDEGELVAGAAAPAETTEPPTTEGTVETTVEEPPPPPATTDAPGGLAVTGDIPVGGGKVFPGDEVVVTQPTPGEFKAFSAVCTHQGCLVNDVTGGTINCGCHGSRFGLDGSVAQGPATKPLPKRGVKVTGDQISLA